jgi:hypothetical protein
LEKQELNYAKFLTSSSIDRKDKWEIADLVRRLCHVLDIAKETLKLLAVEGFINPDDSTNKILPEKVIGETALLLLAASVAGAYKGINDRIKDLAEILIPHARNKRIFLEICLQPALAMEYAQAHVCLTKVGYPDHKFDALLLKSIKAQAHFGRERPPHRMLEQEWIKKIWGYGPLPVKYSVNKTIAHSALTKPIDLLHGTREDMYAFTHALMYVASFNISPWKIQRRRAEILNEAEAILARCLDEQDYDLAGEVLLAWPLTGKSWSASAIFAFRLLTRVEDEAGFLPSPATRLETLQKLDGESRKKYLFATSYHTVYVMGLLCSTSLQPGRTPPKHIPTTILVPRIAHKILCFLDHDQQNTHWRDEFNQLTEPEQDALAGFLINVALTRNVRQRRYGKVYELLKIAYETGLSNTALASQTAELLERIAMISSFEKG